MSAIHNFARYGVVVEIYSEWHSVVYRIMQKLSSNGASGLDAIIKFCIDLIEERGKKVKENQNAEDFLSLLYAMHDKDPDRFKINDNLNHTIPKVAARSDIASATLSATIYSSCKHSRVLGKLRQGLNERRGKGLLSDPITFKEAQECPYLQIVLKETLRMHSDVGLTFPRVVPEGVVTLAGRFFPGGTIVRVNPNVAHVNPQVFGENADSFRPQRWLKDDAFGSSMKQYFLTFGKDSRFCLGKNIGLMKLYEIISTLVIRYDFALIFPERE